MACGSLKQVGFRRRNIDFRRVRRGAALLPFRVVGAMRDLDAGADDPRGKTGTFARRRTARVAGRKFRHFDDSLCARGRFTGILVRLRMAVC